VAIYHKGHFLLYPRLTRKFAYVFPDRDSDHICGVKINMHEVMLIRGHDEFLKLQVTYEHLKMKLCLCSLWSYLPISNRTFTFVLLFIIARNPNDPLILRLRPDLLKKLNNAAK
jgi:hypothetical protein